MVSNFYLLIIFMHIGARNIVAGIASISLPLKYLSPTAAERLTVIDQLTGSYCEQTLMKICTQVIYQLQ